MAKDKLNDENFGTRDKRGNWKPLVLLPSTHLKKFLNPLKLLKYF